MAKSRKPTPTQFKKQREAVRKKNERTNLKKLRSERKQLKDRLKTRDAIIKELSKKRKR